MEQLKLPFKCDYTYRAERLAKICLAREHSTFRTMDYKAVVKHLVMVFKRSPDVFYHVRPNGFIDINYESEDTW